jgi:hypothetical protein
MLNLKIAMRTLWSMTAFVISILLPMYSVQAQSATITPGGMIVFISPAPGQTLQGTILILAETDFDTPTSVTLSFSYNDDPRGTWFHIQDSQDVGNQELRFEWDTTTITDGDYTIRLSAETEQGDNSAQIQGLRVRNYTAVETNTPVPTSTPAPQDTQAPTITPTSTETTIPPTTTALPPNPAQITTSDIWNSIFTGALIILGLFGILGLFQLIRKRSRKKE